jgi:radical SAM superfamily enzyme YgiQ (UPF0313 family)
MNKVIFIQPLGELDKAGISPTNIPEPLSLEYFQAVLEQIDVVSNIYYGNINENELFHELVSDDVIAIGFSVYTYQYPYSLELANKIKVFYIENNKKAPIIIFGGYHPSAQPEIVIQEEAIDIVVKGEGEIAIREIINCILQNESLSNVTGIWYKDNNGNSVHTNPRERTIEIDKFPQPKRDMKFLSKSNQYQILYPSIQQQKSVAQVMYSRGCPFSCVYCSSKNMWGNKVVWRKPEKVLDEIEYLYNNYGTNLIFFPDLTFNLDKNKIIEICNEFVKRNLPVHWSAFFRQDRLDDEMLYTIKEAKCVKIHLGIETDSIDADNLKDDYEMSTDEYFRILNKADGIGLIIRGFLIIGFPDDTVEKIRNYNDFLRCIPIDEVGLSFITPFPGTSIWNEYSQNYLPKDYDFCDFTTKIPVINHPKLTKQDLIDLYYEIFRNFYLDTAYQERILRKITRYPHLKDSFFEYFKFLEDSGVFEENQLTKFI